MNRNSFDVEIIGDKIYRIHEFGASNCYLVVGTEKALLVDTGTGIGNLRDVVESLTDLPVIVVATHAHPDHIGGMGNYPKIYIHEADAKSARFWASKAFRIGYYHTVKDLIKYEMTPKDISRLPYRTKIISIDSTREWDLGNKIVSIEHTPGHTRGSVVVKVSKDNIMFTGDNVNPTLLNIVPGHTTIEDWLPGAKRTLELAKTFKAFNGHDDGRSTTEQISKLVELGEELIHHDPRGFPKAVKYYPQKKTRPRIVYTPWTVRNKNRRRK